MLPFETFKTIIKHTPLISIDLIVSDQKGRILLGKRNNRPAQGYWFVPGGRILKGESMSVAFKRLTLNEIGVEFEFENAKLIGPFEHFYKDNVSVEDFSTHYIALGYRLEVNENLLKLPSEQHDEYKWMSEEQILNDLHVHKHSRWYFNSSAT
ncbi:GDP-mannose mannosyl hydrolase [Shewanella sp. SG41-4]|uniref:GDP-mannose mannosyl hydrolase n=1 Tax=Shewanella sp. SG41-4 TaxID=2760976 RepID=UPI0016004E47|nr:GDP-mannose mannosyl hydrolase [Shewanella sp. SG41-4]MBB1441344.1 GDP-mannose mannosyl hydrolase [Shewanella sp. SG41-4]